MFRFVLIVNLLLCFSCGVLEDLPFLSKKETLFGADQISQIHWEELIEAPKFYGGEWKRRWNLVGPEGSADQVMKRKVYVRYMDYGDFVPVGWLSDFGAFEDPRPDQGNKIFRFMVEENKYWDTPVLPALEDKFLRLEGSFMPVKLEAWRVILPLGEVFELGANTLEINAQEIVIEGQIIGLQNYFPSDQEIPEAAGNLFLRAKKITGSGEISLQGRRGRKGKQGLRGKKGKDTGYQMHKTCTKAKVDGGAGERGDKGDRGGKGGAGGNVFIEVDEMSFQNIQVNSGVGGQGGLGGLGGIGGEGGICWGYLSYAVGRQGPVGVLGPEGDLGPKGENGVIRKIPFSSIKAIE